METTIESEDCSLTDETAFADCVCRNVPMQAGINICVQTQCYTGAEGSMCIIRPIVGCSTYSLLNSGLVHGRIAVQQLSEGISAV
jgi:hypothetical protein